MMARTDVTRCWLAARHECGRDFGWLVLVSAAGVVNTSSEHITFEDRPELGGNPFSVRPQMRIMTPGAHRRSCNCVTSDARILCCVTDSAAAVLRGDREILCQVGTIR